MAMEADSKNKETAPTDERDTFFKVSTTLRRVPSPGETVPTNDRSEPSASSPSMSITRLTHSVDRPSQSNVPTPETASNFSTPASASPHESHRRYSPPTVDRNSHAYDPARQQQQNYDSRENNPQRTGSEFSLHPLEYPSQQRSKNYGYEPETHQNHYSYVPPPQHPTYTLPAPTNGSHPNINHDMGYPHSQPQFQGNPSSNYNGRNGMQSQHSPQLHAYYAEPGPYGPYPVPSNAGMPQYAGVSNGGESPVMYTDDAAMKLTDRIRRRCFNCCSTDTSTWRRSNLHSGKVLCNKCGLFERTHQRSRPEQFPHRRGPLITATLGGRSPPHEKHKFSAQDARRPPEHMHLPFDYNQQQQSHEHQNPNHHQLPPYPTLPGPGYANNGTPYSNAHHVSPYSYSPYRQHNYVEHGMTGPGQEHGYREAQHTVPSHSQAYPSRMNSRDSQHSPREGTINCENNTHNGTNEPRHSLPPLTPLQPIPDFVERKHHPEPSSTHSSTPDSHTANEDYMEESKLKQEHVESPPGNGASSSGEKNQEGARTRDASPAAAEA